MTALTHALGTQGAQLRDALRRFLRGVGETLTMVDAAIRISGAIERRQNPRPADLKALGLTSAPPRFY